MDSSMTSPPEFRFPPDSRGVRAGLPRSTSWQMEMSGRWSQQPAEMQAQYPVSQHLHPAPQEPQAARKPHAARVPDEVPQVSTERAAVFRRPVGWEPTYPSFHRLQDFRTLRNESLLTAGPSALRFPEEALSSTKSTWPEEAATVQEKLAATWDNVLNSMEAWFATNVFSVHGEETIIPSVEPRLQTQVQCHPFSWVACSTPSQELGEPNGSFGRVSGTQIQQPGMAPDNMTPKKVHDLLVSSQTHMASLKGVKKNSPMPNQDRAIYAKFGDGSVQLMGIFDGHGKDGHMVAELARDGLPRILLRMLPICGEGKVTSTQWNEVAARSFHDMHGVIEDLTSLSGDQAKSAHLPAVDGRASGTTATVAVLIHQQLLLAHVGDSSAVIGSRVRAREPGPWMAARLTRDHKFDLPEERARIEAAGAQVVPTEGCSRVYTPHQTWGAINMSRSFGDLHAHWQGVSAVPETTCVIAAWDPATQDAVLILASDGVWDVFTPKEAVEFVAQHRVTTLDVAAALTQEAHARWMSQSSASSEKYADDITAVVNFL